MNITIQNNVPLNTYTTLQVGGTAEYFVTASTEEALVEAVAFAKAKSLMIHILGGGSNTLVSDTGVSGLVIRNCIQGIHADVQDDQVLLTAGAGEDLDTVVAYTVEHNWWGLENLSHIPGTIGAMPVQNVGAYGVETKDVVVSVRVYDTEDETFKILTREECTFAYRDSLFKKEAGKRFVICSVTFNLSINPAPKIEYRDLATQFSGTTPTQRDIREAVMKIREGKFPNWHEVGTAGSFFKNPFVTAEKYKELQQQYPEIPGFVTGDGLVKVPLGWVLDKILNLRGYEKGNVSTYKNQALVLVADRGATASEIKSFADEIIKKIKNEIDVDVEWEVTRMK